jgi:hypothetical protein
MGYWALMTAKLYHGVYIVSTQNDICYGHYVTGRHRTAYWTAAVHLIAQWFRLDNLTGRLYLGYRCTGGERERS